MVFQRVEPQQRRGLRRQFRRGDRFEQAVGHAFDHALQTAGRGLRADRQFKSDLGGEAAARFLEARDDAVLVEGDDARANVHRRHFDHVALFAHGDFRRAAADVDVHHAVGLADGARRGAGAKRRERGFEPVAGGNGNEFASLRGEQVADGAGVGAPHRDARENERAGVDGGGVEERHLVLAVDEGAERLGVDRHVVGVGRQQHVGFVDDFALGHDIAVVQPLKHQAREHKVRGGRTDIDANTDEADFVLFLEAAPHIREKHASADGLVIHSCNSLSRRSIPRRERATQGTGARSAAAAVPPSMAG